MARIEVADLLRLAALAADAEAELFGRNPHASGRYAGRLLGRALCQGAALHYVNDGFPPGRRAYESFSTYSAQTAADSHFRPVPAGRTTVGRFSQQATLPTATPQVRERMSTPGPGWATMHRVLRRCSSVGRAAVL